MFILFIRFALKPYCINTCKVAAEDCLRVLTQIVTVVSFCIILSFFLFVSFFLFICVCVWVLCWNTKTDA